MSNPKAREWARLWRSAGIPGQTAEQAWGAPYWEALKRAVCVAACMGTPGRVLAIARPGVSEGAWIEAAAELGVVMAFMTPCPCGNFDDPRVGCKCTSPQIQKWWTTGNRTVLREAEIQISPGAIPALYPLSRQRGTPLAQHKIDVEQARSRPLPGTGLDPGGELILKTAIGVILKTAIGELDLQPDDVRVRIEVARGAARLDGDSEIRAIHISEAIMYRKLSPVRRRIGPGASSMPRDVEHYAPGPLGRNSDGQVE